MRYLYGDLSEFPESENTLELLRRFVLATVPALLLEFEGDRKKRSIAEDRAFLEESEKQIDQFHETIQKAITDATKDLGDDDVVKILAPGTRAHLKRFVEEGKHRVATRIEDRVRRTESDISDLQAKTKNLLAGFLVPGTIPVHSFSLQIEFEGGQYRATSDILDVFGFQCTYRLDPDQTAFFSELKRFGDLLPGKQDIPVGTRRAWLKKEPIADTLRIDDAILIKVIDTDEYGKFHLAKKGGNGKEGLLIRIDKVSQGQPSVFKVDKGNSKQQVTDDVLTSDYLELLKRFWKELQPKVTKLYQSGGTLTSVRMDGRQVVKEGEVRKLVAQCVSHIAATVREIDRRSPSAKELCLKMEHKNGRREEFYIFKSSLQEQIESLPGKLDRLFDPLGLTRPRLASRPVEEKPTPEPAPSPESAESAKELSDVEISLSDINCPPAESELPPRAPCEHGQNPEEDEQPAQSAGQPDRSPDNDATLPDPDRLSPENAPNSQADPTPTESPESVPSGDEDDENAETVRHFGKGMTKPLYPQITPVVEEAEETTNATNEKPTTEKS